VGYFYLLHPKDFFPANSKTFERFSAKSEIIFYIRKIFPANSETFERFSAKSEIIFYIRKIFFLPTLKRLSVFLPSLKRLNFNVTIFIHQMKKKSSFTSERLTKIIFIFLFTSELVSFKMLHAMEFILAQHHKRPTSSDDTAQLHPFEKLSAKPYEGTCTHFPHFRRGHTWRI